MDMCIKIASGFRERFYLNVGQLFRETLECYRNKSIYIKSLIDRRDIIVAS